MPSTSVDAAMHVESGTQPGKITDNMKQKLSGGCREQVEQGQQGEAVRSQTYTGGSMYVNFAEKRHSGQENNFLPVTFDDGDGYLVPITESVGLTDTTSRKKGIGHQDQTSLGEDNPPNNEDYCEDNVYMSVEDVRSSTVTEKVRVTPIVADKKPVVILQEVNVNKVSTDADSVAESVAAVPVYDSVYDGHISDGRRHKSTDESTDHVQPAFTGSISLGEVIVDTQGTNEWTDLDTAAGSVAAMSGFGSIYEGKDSAARRRKSTDKSVHTVQSTHSVSNGKVVIEAGGADNLLEATEKNLVHNASSKTVEQPALHPGIYTVRSSLELVFYLNFSLFFYYLYLCVLLLYDASLEVEGYYIMCSIICHCQCHLTIDCKFAYCCYVQHLYCTKDISIW